MKKVARTQSRGRALLSMLLLVGGLSGCASNGTAQLTWTGGEREETAKEASGSVLNGDLELLTARHERRDGRLHAQLELFNKNYSNLPFEWKLDWYDNNGFIYQSAAGWAPKVIGGRETHTVGGTAPDARAVSWRFAARRPNVVR